MKTRLFTFLVILITLNSALAQEVASFELNKQKALALNKKNMPLLTGKTWTTYKQYQVNNNEAKLAAGSYMAMKFSADGQLNGTIGNRSFTGNWTLEKKRILHVKVNSTTQESNIEGTYLVYKLTENELLLAANEKSSQNVQSIYYYKGSKTSVLAERPDITAMNVASQQEQKAFEEARKKREQQALINEIETEAQLRGIKMKEKLSEKDGKSLQGIKNQILAGEYGKKEN